MLLGGLLYFLNLPTLFEGMYYRIYENPQEINRIGFSIPLVDNMLYHLKNLFYPNIGLLFGILFIAAIIAKIKSKIKFEDKLLLLTFFIPYFFLIFMPIKSHSHLVPVYFVISILISDFLINVKINKIIKITLMTLVMFSCFDLLLYPLLGNSKPYTILIESPKLNIINSYFRDTLYFRELSYPSPKSSPMEKIFYIMNNSLINGNKNSKVGILSSRNSDYEDLIYLDKIHKSNLSIYCFFSLENEFYLERTYPNGENFSIAEKIKHKELDVVILILPKPLPGEDEKNLKKIYKPSYEVLDLTEFKENYYLFANLDEGYIYGHEIFYMYKLIS
jgi:hypothetical protein